MGILNGRGHELWGLCGGIAKHDALITGALILIGARIHPLGDMGRLLMQKVGDFNRFPMKFVLLIADVFDAISRDLLDLSHVMREFCFVTQAHFAANNNAVCGCECFSGHPCLWFFG